MPISIGPSRPVTVSRPFSEDTTDVILLNNQDSLEAFKTKVADHFSLSIPNGRSLPLLDGRSLKPISEIEEVRESEWVRIDGYQNRTLEEIAGK